MGFGLPYSSRDTVTVLLTEFGCDVLQGSTFHRMAKCIKIREDSQDGVTRKGPMNGEPDTNGFHGRKHHAMSRVGRKEDGIARPQRLLLAVVECEPRGPRQNHNPLIVVLVVPFSGWRGVSP